MIPKKRFNEGIKMKQWQCVKKTCKFFNSVEMSLACAGCGVARPKTTLPHDIMFPFYLPLDTTNDLNRYTQIF